MTDSRPTIFISSARGGAIKDYWSAAKDRLEVNHFSTMTQRDFRAFRGTSLDACEHYLQESQAVLLILGERYGTRVPGDDTISFTEAEYRAAQRMGKHVVALLAAPDMLWPRDEVAAQDPVDRAAQEAFRASVMTTMHAPYEFSDISSFNDLLGTACDDFRDEFFRERLKGGAPLVSVPVLTERPVLEMPTRQVDLVDAAGLVGIDVEDGKLLRRVVRTGRGSVLSLPFAVASVRIDGTGSRIVVRAVDGRLAAAKLDATGRLDGRWTRSHDTVDALHAVRRAGQQWEAVVTREAGCARVVLDAGGVMRPRPLGAGAVQAAAFVGDTAVVVTPEGLLVTEGPGSPVAGWDATEGWFDLDAADLGSASIVVGVRRGPDGDVLQARGVGKDRAALLSTLAESVRVIRSTANDQPPLVAVASGGKTRVWPVDVLPEESS